MGTVEFWMYMFIISIASGVSYRLFGYYASFLCIFGAMICYRNTRVNKKALFSVMAFGIFLITKAVFIDNNQPYSQYFSVYSYVKTLFELVFLILAFQIIRNQSKYVQNNMSRLFLIVYHITILISIFILLRHGTNLYRAKGDNEFVFLAPQNFLFYAITVSMLLTYYAFKKKCSKKLAILLIGLNGVYTIMASYTTQLLFWLLGICVVMFLCVFKDKANRLAVLMLLFVCMLITFSLLDNILFFINENFLKANNSIYERMKEVIRLVSLQDMSGTDLAKRVELIETSLNTFCQNPLFGISFNKYNTVEGLSIGGHSQWPDDLARLGSVGFTLWITMLISSIKYTFITTKNKMSELDIAILFILALYGFFNPFISESLIFLLFIIFNIEKMMLGE